MNRETIMTALAAKLFAAAEFKTTGRRVLMWSQVNEQPAIFLRNIGDEYQRRDLLPPKVTLRAEIWIYCKTDPTAAAGPGAALNALVDAVEAALVPDNVMTNRLTLGGLVHHVWIEGESTFDPGDLDQQAKAVIPIKILVP